MSAPSLEILGITLNGEIAYRLHDGSGNTTDTMTLTRDDLGALARELDRDELPIWPLRECAHCGSNAVAEVEGWFLCRGHLYGYGLREDEAS